MSSAFFVILEACLSGRVASHPVEQILVWLSFTLSELTVASHVCCSSQTLSNLFPPHMPAWKTVISLFVFMQKSWLFQLPIVISRTAYEGKISSPVLVSLVLVSVVVKQALGQESYNLCVLEFLLICLIHGQPHQESLKCQMRSCVELTPGCVFLFGKEHLFAQINIFEHP